MSDFLLYRACDGLPMPAANSSEREVAKFRMCGKEYNAP